VRILTNVTVGDQYTDAATIQNVIASNGGYFLVANNDVFMELQYNIQGQLHWTQEIHVPTGSGQIYPGTTGIRFRNFVAGSAAILSAALSEQQEPAISIGASGVANTGGSGLSIPAPVLVLPAAPADLSLAILTDNLGTPTYNWLFQWVNAASKWMFIGGSPKVVQVNTGQSDSSGNPIDITGCNFTLPRSGVYDTWYTSQKDSGNSSNYLQLLNNGVILPSQPSIFGSTTRGSISAAFAGITCVSGQLLKMQFHSDAGFTAEVGLTTLSILPVYVT
jgi:hypothetical protein